MQRICATIFMSLLVLLATLDTASAARNDRRQIRQHARIHQGVQSGALTHGEAAELRAGQRGIRRAEHRMKADGNFTLAERYRLEQRQDRQSAKIYGYKHN